MSKVEDLHVELRATRGLPHVHGYIRVRMPVLYSVLGILRLPRGWLVQSGDLPHDPDCTPDVGVTR